LSKITSWTLKFQTKRVETFPPRNWNTFLPQTPKWNQNFSLSLFLSLSLSLSPKKKDLIFCNDVCSVIETLGHQLDPTEWRLYIDSLKVSLKLVLLHNREKFPSVALALTANRKLFYENMKLLLEKIQHEKYNWNICGDLKINYLLLDYTKFCCFVWVE
jgi:hypothetical protein